MTGAAHDPVDAAAMQAAADDASALMKALANRHRLLILCRLTDGERSVGDLAGFLGVRDSTVSQHLALLRESGVVAPQREGQQVRYRLADARVRAVMEALCDVCDAGLPASRLDMQPIGD